MANQRSWRWRGSQRGATRVPSQYATVGSEIDSEEPIESWFSNCQGSCRFGFPSQKSEIGSVKTCCLGPGRASQPPSAGAPCRGKSAGQEHAECDWSSAPLLWRCAGRSPANNIHLPRSSLQNWSCAPPGSPNGQFDGSSFILALASRAATHF